MSTIAAPLSFTGSASRIWRLRHAAVWLAPAAVILILCAWAFVACWYLFWGLTLVPYRLIRRGQRRRKAVAALEERRHEELVDTLARGLDGRPISPRPAGYRIGFDLAGPQTETEAGR